MERRSMGGLRDGQESVLLASVLIRIFIARRNEAVVFNEEVRGFKLLVELLHELDESIEVLYPSVSLSSTGLRVEFEEGIMSMRCGVVPKTLPSFLVERMRWARCCGVNVFEVGGGAGKTTFVVNETAI